MSIVKSSDLAYCRLRVPDLDRGERFLHDFGLITTVRTDRAIYLRGTEPTHHCYILEQGEARFLGFAFYAKSAADLETLARATGRPVETIDEPGGGRRVRLTEPNGYDVDVIHGIEAAEPIAIKRQLINTGAQPLLRAGELFRLDKGKPTPVKRLAHVVMGSPQVRETAQWFHDTLGLIPSDEVFAGPERKMVGSFNRVDKGGEYVDHHALFVVGFASAGLQHISFEVQDVDAVLGDNYFLQSLGRYEHLWGIGRHLLGSQIFDYWRDPFGYAHEHWSDTDRLTASAPTGRWDVKDGLTTQWGEGAPERFRNSVKP